MNEPRTTGAMRICEGLREEGVRVIFGHPGGAVLPLYDALHDCRDLRHVLVRHEQSAAHAADGYARATGATGVCLATSGPGALNLVTGLATAAMDSVPIVAVTGQVPRGVMGTDAFQETDILGITIPVTKHGFLVGSPDEIPEVLREAFRIARSGRPGPVLVDVPKDVQAAWSAAPDGGVGPGPGRGGPSAVRAPSTDPDEAALDRAAELVSRARRPVVMAGRGVILSRTADVLRELAEGHGLPVITTLLGLDAFPRSHPSSLGMPGMHGSARANRAIQEADLVLGLGLRFDDRVTGPVSSFAPEARIVLLEVEPASVGRTLHPDVAVIGDLRTTLPALRRRVRGRTPDAWWHRLRSWSRDAGPPAAAEGEELRSDAAITGRAATRALARIIDASGAQVATDVGQHQMWIAQELKEGTPGAHLTSGGLGTMGYALPAAMGAAFGRPDRPTWVVAGDGGFQMTLQELATVVQEGLPLRIAVINNGCLGMVRQWQELFFQGRYCASRLSGPDLAALGRAYGVPSRTVTRRGELDTAFRWAAAAGGPALLDLRVQEEENVYPMVPPGAALGDVIEEPVPPVRPATIR
jgi:acetolactate synthase I/II/III large subunit